MHGPACALPISAPSRAGQARESHPILGSAEARFEQAALRQAALEPARPWEPARNRELAWETWPWAGPSACRGAGPGFERAVAYQPAFVAPAPVWAWAQIFAREQAQVLARAAVRAQAWIRERAPAPLLAQAWARACQVRPWAEPDRGAEASAARAAWAWALPPWARRALVALPWEVVPARTLN